MSFDGILLIDKPKGWTSHDVVAKVRNNLKKQAGERIKVGHTGTLDPLATGLLVLVVGSYTKRAIEFSKLDKTYEVTMKLGETSSTGDEEGEISKISDKKPDEAEVNKALGSFIGEISQTPPAFSAIKVKGKRAYKLARAGKKVELVQRQVTIYDIFEVDYKYPFISFMVKVSSGTYIRSLTEDIGEKLGVGAYMAELRRIEVGSFKLAQSVDVTDVSIDKTIKV